jgi:hypothetical protein
MGLSEHVAPLPAILQIIRHEAKSTIGDETAEGNPETCIQMAAKMPHSV